MIIKALLFVPAIISYYKIRMDGKSYAFTSLLLL